MSKICGRCGKPCDDSAVFCDNCGNRLAAAQPAQKPGPNNAQAQPAQKPGPNSAQAQGPQRGNYNDQYNQTQRGANVPQQNTRPPQGYNNQQPPAPQNQGRSNKGLIVAIVVSASVIFTVLIIILIVMLSSCSKKEPTPVVPTISVQTQPETTAEPTTEKKEEPTTEAPTTAKPTEKATEAPTTKKAQVATEAPAATEAPKVDYSNVGKPSDSDFSGWILRASEAGVPNNVDLIYDSDEINGMWKCMFYYTMTNVRELKNVEILAGDRAATVNITHYQVYVDGAYREDTTPKSVLEGAIDSGSVTAYGNAGKIELYAFYYNGGKEYAIGKYTNQSGETAFVGMVRP